MELCEIEFRKELRESLEKLQSLTIKAATILKNLEEREDDDELIEGLESYKKLLEQEKTVVDYIVIIVNNMFENGLMNLKEATIWYNKLYEARKIAEVDKIKDIGNIRNLYIM